MRYHIYALSCEPCVQAEDILGSLRTTMKRPLVKIMIIGLIIRIALMPLLTYGYDFTHWALIIQHIQAGQGLYAIEGYWYPPVWGYILGAISPFLSLFGVTDYGHLFDAALSLQDLSWFNYTATLTSLAFNVVVKIPIVIADVLVGYMIYKLILGMTGNEKKATYGFALWFLCPIVIYTSAVHGMFDSITVLFMVFSVYSVYKGKYFLAGASLSVAVLTKVFPVYIIFALIAYLALKHKGEGKGLLAHLGKAAAGLLLMTLIIYIPLILDGTVMESLRFLTGRMENISSGAASTDILDWLFMVAQKALVWMQPVTLIFAVILAYMMYRKGSDKKDEYFFLCLMITTALIFLWSPEPRFMLMMLPFLIFFMVMYDRRFTLPYILISVGMLFYSIVGHNFSLLLSLATYTNLLDAYHMVALVEWMNGSFQTGMLFIFMVTLLVTIAGLLLIFIYSIRYGKEARKDEQ